MVLLSLSPWDPAKELVFALSVAKATDPSKRGPSGISLEGPKIIPFSIPFK